jgi:hypothetical protein
VAETLDWGRALVALDRVALDAETVNATLGVLLKYQDDIEKVAGGTVRETLAGVAGRDLAAPGERRARRIVAQMALSPRESWRPVLV